jgi:hypothetical protein
MTEHYEEEPESLNNMSHEEFDELLASEPSPIKRALARVYEEHFSRGDFIRDILPAEVTVKVAIYQTLSRLDTLESDDAAKATVAQIWKEYLESADTEEKAA